MPHTYPPGFLLGQIPLVHTTGISLQPAKSLQNTHFCKFDRLCFQPNRFFKLVTHWKTKYGYTMTNTAIFPGTPVIWLPALPSNLLSYLCPIMLFYSLPPQKATTTPERSTTGPHMILVSRSILRLLVRQPLLAKPHLLGGHLTFTLRNGSTMGKPTQFWCSQNEPRPGTTNCRFHTG